MFEFCHTRRSSCCISSCIQILQIISRWTIIFENALKWKWFPGKTDFTRQFCPVLIEVNKDVRSSGNGEHKPRLHLHCASGEMLNFIKLFKTDFLCQIRHFSGGFFWHVSYTPQLFSLVANKENQSNKHHAIHVLCLYMLSFSWVNINYYARNVIGHQICFITCFRIFYPGKHFTCEWKSRPARFFFTLPWEKGGVSQWRHSLSCMYISQCDHSRIDIFPCTLDTI